MAISLEELKRQREQIQKHLEWLDAKIGEFTTSETELPKAEEVPEVTPPRPEGSQHHIPPETVASQTVPGQDKPNAPTYEPDPDAPEYKAKTANELRRAKVGCLLLFILSVALFLFLLFKLPYLL
jgi:hypothetical protein